MGIRTKNTQTYKIMHTARWLEVLQKFEILGFTEWTNNGNNLKFKATDESLPLVLQQISGRKISLPSIKKNMTLYGFKIVSRSHLEFHNPRYTQNLKDIEGLTRAVQLKNKMDNDKKKLKKKVNIEKDGDQKKQQHLVTNKTTINGTSQADTSELLHRILLSSLSKNLVK